MKIYAIEHAYDEYIEFYFANKSDALAKIDELVADAKSHILNVMGDIDGYSFDNYSIKEIEVL